MTNPPSELYRILLAVDERSPLPALWRVVQEHAVVPDTELVTLFVHDDRWRRAATLPFTREVSRLSGRGLDFTPARAAQIDRDVAGHAERELRRLAASTRLKLVFERLAESEAEQVRKFIRVEKDFVIVPDMLRGGRLHAELTRLRCRMLLVDTGDDSPATTP